MILLTHVLLALGSIAYTTYLYFSPSQVKIRISYGLLASTLASGTYLVISMHASILQSCLMGFMYVGLVSLGIMSAGRKLAHQTHSSEY